MSPRQNNIYYISIGSNLTGGREMVADALNRLNDEKLLREASEIYTTPSISIGDDSTYFNAVAKIESPMTTDQLKTRFKQWESDSGRRAGATAVALDIDIVVANGEVIRPTDFGRNYFEIGYRQLA